MRDVAGSGEQQLPAWRRRLHPVGEVFAGERGRTRVGAKAGAVLAIRTKACDAMRMTSRRIAILGVSAERHPARVTMRKESWPSMAGSPVRASPGTRQP